MGLETTIAVAGLRVGIAAAAALAWARQRPASRERSVALFVRTSPVRCP
jgi:tRNA A37 threonylcarbamoyladenosine modification protein TsaB